MSESKCGQCGGPMLYEARAGRFHADTGLLVCPTTAPMTTQPPAQDVDRRPWTVDDPRMWREQCRVGDVAFQHLFCTSKGKPLPDWVKEGLPNLYTLLQQNHELTAALAAQAGEVERLREHARLMDAACGELNGHATELALDIDRLCCETPDSWFRWNRRDHTPEHKWGEPIIAELKSTQAKCDSLRQQLAQVKAELDAAKKLTSEASIKHVIDKNLAR